MKNHYLNDLKLYTSEIVNIMHSEKVKSTLTISEYIFII